MDCPKGTQTIDVICSGVPSHKELHECCDVTKPFLVVEQMEYDCGISRLYETLFSLAHLTIYGLILIGMRGET